MKTTMPANENNNNKTSVQEFAELAKQVFADATIMPNFEVYNISNRGSSIELVVNNDAMSVYLVDDYNYVAIRAEDGDYYTDEDMDTAIEMALL